MNEHERDLGIWKEGEREDLAAQQHADMFVERAHRLALLDIVTQCVVRHGSDAAIDAVEELFNYLKDT